MFACGCCVYIEIEIDFDLLSLNFTDARGSSIEKIFSFAQARVVKYALIYFYSILVLEA